MGGKEQQIDTVNFLDFSLSNCNMVNGLKTKTFERTKPSKIK